MKQFKIKSHENLHRAEPYIFQLWSGAKERAMMLTYEEMEQVEECLSDLYPDGADETTINDLFWFDFEFVCECIGLQYDSEKDEVIRN